MDEVNREAPDLVSTGVQTLVETAQRLGLTWTLRPATVESAQSTAVVTALYDGDGRPIDMTSLIGFVQPGSRVMVMHVPPAGNYIIGTLLGAVARELIFRHWLPATADVSLTTTATLMPGTQVRVKTTGSFEYEATAFFDFDATVAGVTRCIGELFIDGVAVTSVANFDVTIAENRATVGQQWVGTARASSVFDIRVRRTVTAGTQFARGVHTTLLLKVFQ